MSKAGEYVYGTDGHEGHWLTGEEVVRCRDCRHGHITVDGKYNKWCSLLATHDIDGDGGDPPNGYDPEPYFDSDFYCAWGERWDA